LFDFNGLKDRQRGFPALSNLMERGYSGLVASCSMTRAIMPHHALELQRAQ